MTKTTGEPTEKELELAVKSLAMEHTAGRVTIEGGGVLGEAVNFITKRAPLRFIQFGLLAFLGLHAWGYYTTAQQLVAELEAKRAEAAQAWAEADAANAKINGESTRLATAKAELDKMQAEAVAARAEADAQSARQNGATMRLATLQAELEKTRGEAAKAAEEARVQNQIVEGVPMVVAQRRAEVVQLEAQAANVIQGSRIAVRFANNMANSQQVREGDEFFRTIFGQQ